MKNRPLLIPITCLSMAVPAFADIFVMKDGSRLEATIVKETADSYQLEVQVTKSIKDEKTIAKADVAEIVTEKADEKAFEKIKALVPAPDFTPADEYTRRISTVSKFVAEYPKSAKAAEAETMLTTLKSELEVISGGGIKMDGKLVAGEDYRADLYEIDARILEARIRDAAAKGDVLTALRGTSRMDAEFKATNSRAAIQPLKKQLIRTYKAEVDQLVATFDARMAERQASLARMSKDTRTGTEQALKEELEQAEARFKADTKAEQIWVTTHPFHQESLEKVQETIEQELAEENYKAPGDSGKIYRNILKLIDKTDDANVIREALYKGEQVEIPAKYMKNLKDAATAKGVTF